jgi:hypothetical protein
MNVEKIIGYLLLIAGVIVIIGGTFCLYQVFSGQKKTPEIFSFEAPSVSLPSQQSLEFEIPEGMDFPGGFSLAEPMIQESAGEDQKLKILPDEAINAITNMMVYFLLMGFIASSGAKIAHLGVRMIKEIRVVVKEGKIESTASG